MTPTAWMVFLVAAGVGAPARYLLDEWIRNRSAGTFPWGTFLVNVTGCLVLGVLTGLGQAHSLSPTARTVLGTGGTGAFTTFSTFTFETVRLAEDGAVDVAVRYATGSFLVGLGAAALGAGLAAAA